MTTYKKNICTLLTFVLFSTTQSSIASPDAVPPLRQYLVWKNWTGNFRYQASFKDKYYFTPTTRTELKEIIQNAAKEKGKIKIHVSGQRHSATPIILNHSEDFQKHENTMQNSPTQWIIDLSCYRDLGESSNKNIVISPNEKTVTVNTGVREDELDAYLTAHNFMLKTVTAGGFFSIGGMSAVDVHGATVNETNFPGTIKSFTVMNASGEVSTYDNDSKQFDGFNPLQFHRVSLGTLGIITSVTINIEPRPFKESLVGSQSLYTVNSEREFINLYKKLLFSSGKSRVESFYNPYYTTLNIRALKWDIDHHPANPKPNDSYESQKIKSACQIANDYDWGAPLLNTGEDLVEKLAQYTQNHSLLLTNAGVMISFAFENIRQKMEVAIQNHSSTWLTSASRVTFMSYAIPLPDNASKGLDVAWKALRVVNEVSEMMKNSSNKFALSAPVEFRFLRGDNAILSAAYSKNLKNRYVAIEIIGFTDPTSPNYFHQNLLNFFANVECRWLKLNGRPHQGKMYGFYNPDQSPDCKNVVGSAPFNEKYLTRYYANNESIKLNLAAFKAYQKQSDPDGMFCTAYGAKIGIC